MSKAVIGGSSTTVVGSFHDQSGREPFAEAAPFTLSDREFTPEVVV